MKPNSFPLLKTTLMALALALSIAGVCTAQTTPPDLTQPGVIAAIKAKTDRPNYIYNYNLGPTGLRGWVHYDGSGSWIGQMTDASRQTRGGGKRSSRARISSFMRGEAAGVNARQPW